MYSRLLLALLAAWGAALPARAQNGPADFDGVFAVDYISCDCDPADFVFATRSLIRGYDRPSVSGRQVRTVDSNRRIEGNDWDAALTVTVRPGAVRARRGQVIRGYPLGRGRRPVPQSSETPVPVQVLAGAEIAVLMVENDGSQVVRIGDENYAGVEETADGSLFSQLRDPVEQVWLHLTAKPGRPAAWVPVDWRSERGGNLEILCGTQSPC